MPRTFFDLNLLANMVAKLGSIVGEHVKVDMFANNVGQFGHTLTDDLSYIKPGTRPIIFAFSIMQQARF